MSDFFSKNIKPCAYIPKLFLKALVAFTERKPYKWWLARKYDVPYCKLNTILSKLISWTLKYRESSFAKLLDVCMRAHDNCNKGMFWTLPRQRPSNKRIFRVLGQQRVRLSIDPPVLCSSCSHSLWEKASEKVHLNICYVPFPWGGGGGSTHYTLKEKEED